MPQTLGTIRLHVLTALCFAVGVLLAPVWHAAQAAQPIECCTSEILAVQTEPTAFVADASEPCGCCVDAPPAETSTETAPPLPAENDAPCPDDGHCPCCKTMVVVSLAVPIPAPAVSTIDQEPQAYLPTRLPAPDSRGLGTEPQPPKR